MKKLLSLLFTALALTFLGCNDDDDPASESDNLVFITDDITQVTTWYADSIYIIDDHDFWVENTLTIQAGTIVKFKSNNGMTVDDDGTIVAVGTAQKPIVFTSFKDDDQGGDSNGDGSASSPSKGNWLGISVTSNGNSFSYCTFSYGGGSSYLHTLEIFDGRTDVTYCTFVHNGGGKFGDFYYGALSAGDGMRTSTIRNNVFYDNTLPLSIPSSMSLDASNTFHNPNNINQTNTMKGIFVYDQDHFATATTWSETEVPYVINDNDLWITTSLTLASNVIVKFTPTSELIVGTGATLSFNGSNFFTSFKDDNHGGDTNGDGSATSPSNNDWGGIYNDATSAYYSHGSILYDSH